MNINPAFKTPPVVKNLIIANCLLFLATYLIPSVDSFLGRYGQLFWVGSPNFHLYQFVSYMFLHGSISHLFFNMFALWMFGRTLEYELGERRFLIYYLVCGIGAAIFQMLVAWAFGEVGFRMLGASGATMGLLMAFGVMHPNNQIFVFPIPMPIKAKWFVVGYIVLEIVQGWGVASDGIAHFAHVGGMLWGWALLHYWKNKRVIWF